MWQLTPGTCTHGDKQGMHCTGWNTDESNSLQESEPELEAAPEIESELESELELEPAPELESERKIRARIRARARIRIRISSSSSSSSIRGFAVPYFLRPPLLVGHGFSCSHFHLARLRGLRRRNKFGNANPLYKQCLDMELGQGVFSSRSSPKHYWSDFLKRYYLRLLKRYE